MPGVAAVSAFPELSVGERGEHAAGCREQRVRHRWHGFGQASSQERPRLSSAPPVDARLRIAAAVRREGSGARGDVPPLRVLGVDGDRPRVVPVAAVVGSVPGIARVAAPRRASAARFVRPRGVPRMPRERVHVGLRAGTMVGPRLAAVRRAHEAAELDADEDQVCLVRAGRDPANVRRPRPGREAPRRPRRQLEQRGELAPGLAAVVTPEEPARLRPRVDGAVGRAHCQREDAGLG